MVEVLVPAGILGCGVWGLVDPVFLAVGVVDDLDLVSRYGSHLCSPSQNNIITDKST